MTTYYVQTDGNNGNAGTSTGPSNAWADPGYAASQMGTGDVCYVKTGTYTVTSTTPGAAGPIVMPANVQVWMEGYESTPGDACPTDSFPVIQANGSLASGVTLFTGNGATSAGQVFYCLEADGNGDANADHGFEAEYGLYVICVRCIGRDLDIDCFKSIKAMQCEAHGESNSTYGYYLCDMVSNSYSTGTLTNGINGTYIINSISYNDGGIGIYTWGISQNCSVHSSGGDSYSGQNVNYINCIAYNGGGYSFTGYANGVCVNCADDGATSGRLSGPFLDLGGITLTADPFTNAASGDFSLNAAAGGGALCKDAGASTALQSISREDVGAVETTASGGGGLLVHPGTSGGMRG